MTMAIHLVLSVDFVHYHYQFNPEAMKAATPSANPLHVGFNSTVSRISNKPNSDSDIVEFSFLRKLFPNITDYELF